MATIRLERTSCGIIPSCERSAMHAPGLPVRFGRICQETVKYDDSNQKPVFRASASSLVCEVPSGDGFADRYSVLGKDAVDFWHKQGVETRPKQKLKLLNPLTWLPWLREKLAIRKAIGTHLQDPSLRDKVLDYLQGPGTHTRQAKSILDAHAAHTLHYLGKNCDHEHFTISRDGQSAVISYKVAGGVAMAMGGPCGDLPAEEVLAAWTRDVKARNLKPCVALADSALVTTGRTLGYKALPIGHEAMVNLETFTLTGKAVQDLRTARNRGLREGWVIREYRPDDWPRIDTINKRWLKKHGNYELEFGLGKSTPKYLSESRTVVLTDKDGQLLGYCNLIELPGSRARSIDLMRRDDEAPNGVMEALFLHEIEQAKADGFKYFDLGMAPLSLLDEADGQDSPAMAELLRLTFEHGGQLFDFKGLYNFKKKFRPEWHPYYLLYPGPSSLPGIGYAMIKLSKFASLLNPLNALDFYREKFGPKPEAPDESRTEPRKAPPANGRDGVQPES